jgi:hypothetical protein
LFGTLSAGRFGAPEVFLSVSTLPFGGIVVVREAIDPFVGFFVSFPTLGVFVC